MTMRRQMVLVALALIALTVNIAAQTQNDLQKARPRTTTSDQKKPVAAPAGNDRLEPDDTNRAPADVSDEMQANRMEQMSEEAAVNPFYNNFFSTYRLGPED